MDPEGSQGFENIEVILLVFSPDPLIPEEVKKEGSLKTGVKTIVS